MQTKTLNVLFAVGLATAGVAMIVTGLIAQDEVAPVDLAAIHNTTIGAADVEPPALLPPTLRVNVGDTVRLFNTSTDPADFLEASPHDPVVISSDEDGLNEVFEVTLLDGPESSSENGFRVNNGEVTVVEFVADQAGEFFISHRPHGHGIVGFLIVEE